MIPKTTSTVVTTDKSAKTNQILFVFETCSCAITICYIILNEIKYGENKYPNQVNEVPVKTYFLYHFVGTSSFVSSE